jgi:hypothetical protein
MGRTDTFEEGTVTILLEEEDRSSRPSSVGVEVGCVCFVNRQGQKIEVS